MTAPSKTNQVTINYSPYKAFGGWMKGKANVRSNTVAPLKPNKTGVFIK
jgi:hypothetical protein